jgi:DNA-binding MarR family transcriptional regulator
VDDQHEADGVDRILAQWQRERPDLDVSPMAVIGRLSRAAAAVENRLADTYAQLGIDASAFDVLATLLRNGPPHALTPAALADSAMLTSSAIAQRVNRLVSRGLVERAPHPTDGRQTLVHLTPAGRGLVERALPRHLETEWAILADLDRDDRAALIDLLQRVSRSASDTWRSGSDPSDPH